MHSIRPDTQPRDLRETASDPSSDAVPSSNKSSSLLADRLTLESGLARLICASRAHRATHQLV
jgi:hypothetical protein